MISKSKIKYIQSLARKKKRTTERVFVAEGPKVVGDLLSVLPALAVFATSDWMDDHHHQCGQRAELTEVTNEELRRISFLQHPQEVLAVFPQFTDKTDKSAVSTHLTIALDGIQDPGNLGTIIRIADWFGITDIFCSLDTADIYNPKVVQATMGSIARVNITYTDLPQFIDSLPANIPIYGTLLDGKNLYNETLSTTGLIVMGNEGNGISSEIRRRITHRLLIPNYPQGRETAESLNVAIAAAITCSEFRRRQMPRTNK